MPHQAFYAKAEWDPDARVWFIAETNFPGLVAEAETQEALREKIHALIPELWAENRHLIDWEPDGDLPISLMAESLEHVRIPG